MSKRIIIKKTLFLSIYIAFIVTISLLIVNFCNNDKKSSFRAHIGYYNSDQYEIGSVSDPSDTNIIMLSNMYTINGSTVTHNGVYPNDGQTITISSTEELYAFSKLCNSVDAFLDYNYKLLTNIDYTNYPYEFEPIAWNNKEFTGIFDGYGHEIKGLKLVSIAQPSSNEDSAYAAMTYYGMFSIIGNGGKVSNFGLIDTNIILSIDSNYINLNQGGVAPVAGYIKSGAELSYVFVRDLRDQEDAGLAVMGGHNISGLAYKNSGSIHDCYAAYSLVVNQAVNDYEAFCEILSINEGDYSKLFYYNESITDVKVANGLEIVSYSSSTVGKDITRPSFATNTTTLKTLNSSVKNSNSAWYVSSSYNPYGAYLESIITPITRGLELEGNVFEINDESDYSYMYELMNANDFFASSTFTYQITNNINLGLLSGINYTYNSNIASTIEGVSNNNLTNIVKADGSQDHYPTIFNCSYDNSITVEGIDAYGVFPYLTGTVRNLNIVSSDITPNIKQTSNLKSIGILCGYVEGGVIDNVNIYTNFSLPNNIGKYYFGGLAGLVSGSGTITNCTASGLFTDNNQTTISEYSGFAEGYSIGGIAGYLDSTLGNINTCLSALDMNISAAGEAAISIGGVIGSGYLADVEKLENKGNITVLSSSNSNELYVSGIVARCYGISQQLNYFNNIGDIAVDGGSSTNVYVSGVINADIITARTEYLSVSKLNELGKYRFYAASFTNAANINVSNADDAHYTSVLNVNSSNNFISELSGIYNLGYRTVTTYDQDSKSSNTSTQVLDSQNIYINHTNQYASIINNIGGSSTYCVNITTAYNLRNINISLSGSEDSIATYTYSGCALGGNINYSDVRNEGDINVELNNTISKEGSLSSLYVNGVFDTLSNGCLADVIYNGGDITINENSTNNVYLNIYASGICRENKSVLIGDEYNPLAANNAFDKESKGSINSAINSGNISVSSNHLVETTEINNAQTTYFYGNVYTAGIANSNEGIISNAFNTGNIFTCLYGNLADSSLEAGGIVYQNNGQYAQIRDCANNGDIKVISLGVENRVYVNVGGIACSNTNSSSNNQQIIAFTINYGTLYAFGSYANNGDIPSVNCNTRAGGILANGICNIVNVVNYGNVYSSENGAGMITTINLDTFDNSSVTIANALNFANIIAFYKVYSAGGSEYYATMKNVIDVASVLVDRNASQSIPYYQHTGALFSVINYDSKDIINIRYLINFNDKVDIISNGGQLNIPANVSTDVTRLVTTRVNNLFAGKQVKFAPLSTISDENGNIGVFAKEFAFRKAIDGIDIDENEVTDKYIADFFQFVAFDKVNDSILEEIGWDVIAYLDAAERFSRDLNALATLFDNNHANITGSSSVIDSDTFNGDTWIYNCDTDMLDSIITHILDSGELDELKELLDYIYFDSTNTNLITNSYRSAIIDSLLNYYKEKAENNNEELDYYNLLNSLLYDELMAKIIAKENVNYTNALNLIKECLQNCSSDELEIILDNYISVLKNEVSIGISNANSLLYPLFAEETKDYYTETKVSLLTTLLSGYSEETIDLLIENLSQTGESESAKFALVLQNLTVDEKKAIYASIITNNDYSSNDDYIYAMNQAFTKYGIYDLVTDVTSSESNNYDPQVLANFKYSDLMTSTYDGEDITSLGIDPSNNYVDLWNQIKNTEVIQNYLNDILSDVYAIEAKNGVLNAPGIYAKATEYTNTYQTNDAPSTVGATVGVVRPTSSNNSANNRFIYTPDNVVSEGTYYYGPYINKNSNTTWQQSIPNCPLELNFPLADATGTDTSRRYVPIFISLDSDFLQQKINGKENDKVYEFYLNTEGKDNGTGPSSSSAQQWVSMHICEKSPADCQGYLIKNYNTPHTIGSNDGNYIMYNYDFNPNYNRSYNYESSASNPINDATYLNSGSVSNGTFARNSVVRYKRFGESGTGTGANAIVNGVITIDGVKYENWVETTYKLSSAITLSLTTKTASSSSISHALREYYLKSYMSAALITGIWAVQDIWYSGGLVGAYIPSKNNEGESVEINGQKYRGYHTTQYINYFVDDLILLDGVLTKGDMMDGSVASSDELNIINAVMSKILSSNEGQRVVLQALASNAEAGYTAAEAAFAESLINALKSTDFAYMVTENMAYIDKSRLQNISYNGHISLYDYYYNIASEMDLTSIQQATILCSENLSNFRTLLIELYERAEIAAEYNGKPIDNDDVNKLMISYVNSLLEQNPDLTDEDIALVNKALQTDLLYINNLLSYGGNQNTLTNNFNNYGNNLDSLSDISRFILTENEVMYEPTSTSLISINEPSYVLVNATGSSFSYDSNTQYYYNENGQYKEATIYVTDGSLYTLDEDTYNRVLSGSYSETTDYYIYEDDEYILVNVKEFATDGSLYILDNGNYSSIKSQVTINNIDNLIYSNGWYSFYITSANEYTINTYNASVNRVIIVSAENTITISNTNVGSSINNEISVKGNTIFNDSYYDLVNYNINNVVTGDNNFNLNKYQALIDYFDYQRYAGTYNTGSNASKLRENDFYAIATSLFSTMKETVDGEDYYTIFSPTNNSFSYDTNSFDNANLISLIKYLALADCHDVNSVFGDLAYGLGSDYYNQLVEYVMHSTVVTDLKLNTGYSLDLEINTIKKIRELSNNDLINAYFLAAYVGADFIANNNNNSLLDSILKEVLDNYSNGAYQFIISNTDIDTEKFNLLMKHVGFNLTTEGYGIYALSSSKGIGDGIFVPDNFSLISLDSYYKLNELNYWEIYNSKDANGNDTDKSADWRGGLDSNGSADKSDKASVNYAFLVEMKQLKQAITTTIFTLDLQVNIGGSDVILYSSESLIDLENHTITYYVPTNSFDSSKSALVVEIECPDSVSSILTNGLDIIPNTTSLSLSKGVNDDVVTIIAEDTTVISNYDIIIEYVDISFDLSSDDQIIAASDEAFIVDVISPANNSSGKLPEGFDLTPYITITNGNDDNDINDTINDKFNSADNSYKYFELSKEDGDHIIDSTGNTTMTMNIYEELPYGEYVVTVNIFGVSKTINFTKISNDQSVFEGYFEGDLINFVNGTANNTILFGKAYDYNKLLDLSYLDSYSISSGATMEVAVSKNDDTFITYTVEITVTAENGNNFTKYTHKLTEYVNPSFTLYLDGNAESVVDFDGATQLYVQNGNVFDEVLDSEEFDLETVYFIKYNDEYYKTNILYENKIYVNFDRGLEPKYRIKYNINGFDNRNATYDVVYIDPENDVDHVTVEELSAGYSISFADGAQTSTYTYSYKYVSRGQWHDGEYLREFNFNELIIKKNYSKDATISRLTFLDGYEIFSGMSTFINPNTAIRPITEAEADDWYAGEVEYSDIREANYSREVAVVGKKINYQANQINYAQTTGAYYTDFFALGSIANAQLSNYAPTFAVDEYAEIYQYTTKQKLKVYGQGKQSLSDTEILVNHDDMLLYVPYEVNGYTANFLVQIDNGQWTYVYTTSYDGMENGADSEYYVADLTSQNIYSSSSNREHQFTISGITYTLSSASGMPTNNSSLYMDYIGDPLDDHFWYISYVVFSEEYLNDSNHGTDSFNNIYFKCYHISLIDLTNTILFETVVKASSDFELEQLFLTFSVNVYDDNYENIINKQQLSAYASNAYLSSYEVDRTVTEDNFASLKSSLYLKSYVQVLSGSYDSDTAYYKKQGDTYTLVNLSNGNDFTTDGSLYVEQYDLIKSSSFDSNMVYYKKVDPYKIYTLVYSIQTLPNGYFHFYIDLPEGYGATCKITNDKINRNVIGEDYYKEEEQGAYLPPASFVTQRVNLEIVINNVSDSDGSVWGQATATTYTRIIELQNS